MKIKLKYGENPHQSAAWYMTKNTFLKSFSNMTFNDLQNLKAGYFLLSYMEGQASTIIVKHVNIAGAAQGGAFIDRLQRAINTDPRASMNGIVMTNEAIDKTELEEIEKFPFDGIAAPLILASSQKLKNFVMDTPTFDGFKNRSVEARELGDGSFVQQERFVSRIHSIHDFKGCNEVDLCDELNRDVIFAWRIACAVKTNAAVVVKEGETLSVAAGHQDGVTAIEHAIYKAKFHSNKKLSLENAVIAVDGNFPHDLPLNQIVDEGITVFVLPGMTDKDEQIMSMFHKKGCHVLFSLERCFLH